MKRLRLLVLAGVLAAALPIGMTAAGASGGSSPSNYVTIKDRAQFDLQGTYIQVGGTVKCHGGGLRVVEVFVTQKYPQTPHPQGAYGLGTQSVVCDGKERSYAATVPPGLFDAGKAHATATLDPLAPTATASKWITIVHV